MTTARPRPWTAWLLSPALAFLWSTFAAAAAGAQQGSTVSASARVIQVDPAPSPETLGGLLQGLTDREPGTLARRGTGRLRIGVSVVSAARECPRRDSEGCMAVVTVEYLGN
jgi:hypothetical protein